MFFDLIFYVSRKYQLLLLGKTFCIRSGCVPNVEYTAVGKVRREWIFFQIDETLSVGVRPQEHSTGTAVGKPRAKNDPKRRHDKLPRNRKVCRP